MKTIRRQRLQVALWAALYTGAANAAVSGGTPPIAGSPGSADRALAVRDGCPTFSWSEVEGREYEIAAYRLLDGGTASAAPPLHTRIEGAFLSWTPSLEECLPPGRYAWVVRANTAAGWTEWSEPRLFEVRDQAPGARRPVAPEPARPAPATRRDGRSPAIVEFQTTAGERLFTSAPQRPRPLTGAAFSPPSCNGTIFSDVTGSNPNCAWIEQLVADEIAQPCEDNGIFGQRFCPDQPVTRSQIAKLLGRAMRGTNAWRPEQGDGATPNAPPAPTGAHGFGTDANGHISITIGADGLGLISFYVATDAALKVAHCADVSCTTATFSTVDSESAFAYTSITIGADGFALISYYDASNHDLKVAHCSNVECTAVDEITPLDTDGDVGQYTSITIGADGFGLISYYDATNGDLKVAHCSNLKCTAATFGVLDGSGGTSTSIAIGGDGLGLISYRQVTSGVLAVAHCANVNCTGADWVSFPYGFLTAGSYTSMATGVDGLGLIAFYVGIGDQDFNIGHCVDPRCTNFDTGARVEFPITSSLYTSLTIGSDGFGLVSYHVASTGDLKVAHCGDVGCNNVSVAQLDTAGLVGEFNAITIGSDGFGLISYYDATNGDLKVAHCSNVRCAPYFRRR